jgi:hypothetical protein
VALARRLIGLAAIATTGCSILFGIRAEDFVAGASSEAGVSAERDAEAIGDVEAGAPPLSDGAIPLRTLCLDPAHLQTFMDPGAGTVVPVSGSSVEITFASRSDTTRAAVRGYSELDASPGLDTYGSLRLRARFRTLVGDAGLASWTPVASWVTVLAAIAGPWSQLDQVGRVALYIANDTLSLAVFPNGDSVEIDRTLVSDYPNDYSGDVSVMIPLHTGEIVAEADGGPLVSVEAGLAPPSAGTMTLLAGGSANPPFSSTTVTITMLCVDLMP